MNVEGALLQGLNIGGGGGGTREIKIRLRNQHNVTRFLDWHSVMGTMLHGARFEACNGSSCIVRCGKVHVRSLASTKGDIMLGTRTMIDLVCCAIHFAAESFGVVHAEMAHNIISPHNAEFFKLWDELWEVRHFVLCLTSTSKV